MNNIIKGCTVTFDTFFKIFLTPKFWMAVCIFQKLKLIPGGDFGREKDQNP